MFKVQGFDMGWRGLSSVISGGQTGADTGGLLAAITHGLHTSGTAPALFKTALGSNPALRAFGLVAEGTYATRTRKNIENSDGTVLVAYNLDSSGTKLTRDLCRTLKKPYIELNIYKLIQIASMGPDAGTDSALKEIQHLGEALKLFIAQNQIDTLNVAGNRELPEHEAGQYGRLVVTTSTEWIVGYAMDLLELDGNLIFET